MLVTIPEVFVTKSEQNIWNVEIWIAEELFDYLHPLLFQDFFSKKLTKDQFQVLFELIKVYSSSDIRKEFHIQHFLDNYPSILSGKQKKQMKEYFIDYLQVLNQQPKLTARYGQVKYKTPDHGDIHGLPTNEKGKTPKTEANALSLRDSLVKMPEREGIQWFDNGGYQKGTKRGYDSVNLYDKDKRVIAIYKKQENGEYLFSTTCEVTGKEEAHLLESGGNYLTEAVLNNQKALTITDTNNNDLQ